MDELTRHIFIRELIGLLVDDVLQTTEARLEQLATAVIRRHRASAREIVALQRRDGGDGQTAQGVSV